MTQISPAMMSNQQVLDSTARAACDERRATAELLALLGELDARRLYLGEGCSSLFAYCTQVLHLSEHTAYHRIEGARASRQFPGILKLLADGAVTLTTVAMLRPHLTADNHATLLEAARHRSKRDVEHQIASLAPRPDATAIIRRVPAQSRSGSAPEPPVRVASSDAPASELLAPRSGATSETRAVSVNAASASTDARPTVAPLTSDRYLLRVTLSAEAHAKLRRAQALMRHTVPNGDLAEILDKALTLLVDQLEKTKIAKTSRPQALTRSGAARSSSRHIPAAVRREAWARDEGRCAFVGSHGRCTETSRLEYHHVVPYARGGTTDVQNIALRCRAHNRFESEEVFGPWVEAG